MSKLYLIADMHFGHKNVCRFRTEFSTMDEHENYIMKKWQSVITKNDTVYVLGDAAFTQEGLKKIATLNGRKILIAGNHDDLHASKYLQVFHNMKALMTKKDVWLSHAPIHPEELRGKFNIHGHVHNNTIQDNRYMNVCCEVVGYTPIEFDVALERLRESNNENI